MEQKRCTCCGLEKLLAQFWIRHRDSCTRHAQCIECMKQKRDAPEALAKQRSSERLRYAANASIVLEKNKRWRQRNPDKLAAKSRRWYAANPEKHRKIVAAWCMANVEKMRVHRQGYYIANREKIRAAIKTWNDENRINLRPARAKAQAAKRSLRLHATPAWADEFIIGEAYHLAQLRQQICGGVWHVDHVVPLQGRTVCGLHVENNLRVIPGVENMRKGNRHWPDMP
jgi:hypothetical protein